MPNNPRKRHKRDNTPPPPALNQLSVTLDTILNKISVLERSVTEPQSSVEKQSCSSITGSTSPSIPEPHGEVMHAAGPRGIPRPAPVPLPLALLLWPSPSTSAAEDIEEGLIDALRSLNPKVNADLSINSKLLLNSDSTTLEALLQQQQIKPESLTEMMQNVQEWYRKQPHLPQGQLHDQLLVRLLIMRNYSLENVKKKIDNYYTARNSIVELLTNRDPMTVKINTYLNMGYWIVLPQRTPLNHRVTIFRIKSCEDISVTELIKVAFMIADYRLWNDTVLGEQCILDFDNVTIQLTMQLTPVLISKIVFYITSCIGPKLKGVHLVHLPKHAVVIFNLFKKLIKPKLVNRIHVYNKFEEAKEEFPENILPKDLGGTADVTCQEIADAWLKTFSSTAWRNYFLEQDSIKSDETKRKNLNDMSMEGSFKKLNID